MMLLQPLLLLGSLLSHSQAARPLILSTPQHAVASDTNAISQSINLDPDPFPEEDKTYTKYEHYPPYCSTPQEMEKRAIPPLSDTNIQTQLVHVTALIRHGSRTPFSGAPSYKCWNGYWESPDTGVWNCDLLTYMSPPATTKEKGKEVDEHGNLLDEEPDFLFEKRYDALLSKQTNGGGSIESGNILNGTCQMGQLLARGYEQELSNGKHLRQAYFYDGDKTADEHAAADPRMRLWDLTKDDNSIPSHASQIGDPTKVIFQEPNLKYRADDEQRTLMSGQVLLRGLFGPELAATGDDETAVIKLHTADYTVDVLTPNGKVCPRVEELRNEAYESEEYKSWVQSSIEAKTTKSLMKDEMGIDEVPEVILDCMMTTICTDRNLPDALNDYDGTGGGNFEVVADFAVNNFTFPYKYNGGAYSKLGMGPLWLEIMSNILQIVDANHHPPTSSGMPPPKLALFSGHDTTLMPILATLGEQVWSGKEWSPYASMLQIEIHEVLDTDERYPSGYAFRLIYNGNVLTSKMEECSAAELCDIQVLVKQVMSFASEYGDENCAAMVKSTRESKMGEIKDVTVNLLSTPGGAMTLLLLVVISMALGSVATCFIMRRRLRREYKYADTLALTELSMSALDDDENDISGNVDRSRIESAVSSGIGLDENTTDENSLI
eukprot:scaffold5861_cov98-Skeletonema_dohrnii-CCMP3373.AAC.7